MSNLILLFLNEQNKFAFSIAENLSKLSSNYINKNFKNSSEKVRARKYDVTI